MSTSMANRILRAAAPLILCGSCALTGGCKSLGLSQPETVTSEQVLGKLDATEKATPPPAPEIVALPAPQPAPQPMLAPPAPAPAPRPAFTTAPAGFAEEAETSVPATVARAPAPRHQGSSSRSSGHVAATAQGGGKTHVVQRGETLQKISLKYYGTTTKWTKIFEANKAKIKRADLIVAGMKIVIP
jgi:nucleoid-associated protein YgaU